MDIDTSAFKEPRGVMRIFHFIFSICAFWTITSYSGYIIFKCQSDIKLPLDYPFHLNYQNINLTNECKTTVEEDYSTDAEFFVATGVLAMLYAIAITFVYIKHDNLYKSNPQLPMIDFVITVIYGVLWLSSSAAWANGLSNLKSYVESLSVCNCAVSTTGYNGLNISVIFGFLNFFLWAADLWFLYKETSWFRGNPQQINSSV